MRVLIETYWNVNFLHGKGFLLSRSRVLIETYWNVNLTFGCVLIHHILVLIETYWNVNFITSGRIKGDPLY